MADEFLDLADSFGYKWCNGGLYVEDNCWRDYGSNTAYYLFKGKYDRVLFYLKRNCNIIKFKSFKTKNTKNPRGFKKKKAFVKL